MLCRRSASPIGSTRVSSAMASRSLQKFSACSACLVIEPAELGQAVDQPRLLAERLVDVHGDRRVFDRVVQHRRRDGVMTLNSVRMAATSRGWEK